MGLLGESCVDDGPPRCFDSERLSMSLSEGSLALYQLPPTPFYLPTVPVRIRRKCAQDTPIDRDTDQEGASTPDRCHGWESVLLRRRSRASPSRVPSDVSQIPSFGRGRSGNPRTPLSTPPATHPKVSPEPPDVSLCRRRGVERKTKLGARPSGQ